MKLDFKTVLMLLHLVVVGPLVVVVPEVAVAVQGQVVQVAAHSELVAAVLVAAVAEGLEGSVTAVVQAVQKYRCRE